MGLALISVCPEPKKRLLPPDLKHHGFIDILPSRLQQELRKGVCESERELA